MIGLFHAVPPRTIAGSGSRGSAGSFTVLAVFLYLPPLPEEGRIEEGRIIVLLLDAVQFQFLEEHGGCHNG